MIKVTALSLVLLPLLFGCLTIRDSKSLVLTPPPEGGKIAVTANAVAHCQDLFFVLSCTLDLEIHEVK